MVCHEWRKMGVGDVADKERGLSISRVPDQNGISQACYIVEIYHSGLELSILLLLGRRVV